MAGNTVRFFICGSALSGQPDHGVLEKTRFLQAIRTAPEYRMHSVEGRHPGIYHVSSGGVSLLGELYELTSEQHEALLAQEPPGLYEEQVSLEDGSLARAMLFPRDVVERRGYPDVSEFGGWAAFKASGRL
jgi:gamma-glutamylaminecyclotransferase